MDLAAIWFALLALVVIVVLALEFFLWLRVKFEHRASVLEWKGVVENAVRAAESAQESVARWESEGRAEAQATSSEGARRVAQLEADIQGLGLKLANLQETFTNFLKKDAARDREENRRRAKEEQQPDGEGEGLVEGGSLEEALAEQARLSGQAQAQAGVSRAPRLVVKRRIRSA